MTISGFLLSAALVLQAPTYETGVDARLDGRFEEAAEILAEVAQREPANADVFLQLGLTLSALGRFDEAEAALQRTLDLAPDYTDAHIALARLAYYRGDLDRAAELAAALPDDQTPPDLRARIDAARESPARSPWQPGWPCAHGASEREGSRSGGGGLLHGCWVRCWAVDCDAPQPRRGQHGILRPPGVRGVGVPHVHGLVGNVAHGVDEGVAALRIQVSLEAAHWVGNVQALLTSRLREQRQQARGDAEKIRGESNRSGTERCGGDSAGRCIHADHPLRQ